MEWWCYNSVTYCTVPVIKEAYIGTFYGNICNKQRQILFPNCNVDFIIDQINFLSNDQLEYSLLLVT